MSKAFDTTVRGFCTSHGEAFTDSVITVILEGPRGGTKAIEAMTVEQARDFVAKLNIAIRIAEVSS